MVLGGWEGGGRRENKGKKRERDSKTRRQSNGGVGGRKRGGRRKREKISIRDRVREGMEEPVQEEELETEEGERERERARALCLLTPLCHCPLFLLQAPFLTHSAFFQGLLSVPVGVASPKFYF